MASSFSCLNVTISYFRGRHFLLPFVHVRVSHLGSTHSSSWLKCSSLCLGHSEATTKQDGHNQAPKERLRRFILSKYKIKQGRERPSVLQSGCLQCKGTVVILQTSSVEACPAPASPHPVSCLSGEGGRGRWCWLLRPHTKARHPLPLLAQFSVPVGPLPSRGGQCPVGAPHRHGSRVPGRVRRGGAVPAAGVWGQRGGGGVPLPLPT